MGYANILVKEYKSLTKKDGDTVKYEEKAHPEKQRVTIILKSRPEARKAAIELFHVINELYEKIGKECIEK